MRHSECSECRIPLQISPRSRSALCRRSSCSGVILPYQSEARICAYTAAGAVKNEKGFLVTSEDGRRIRCDKLIVSCGGLAGIWVQDGDNILIHLPIPDDQHSYLLITVQKTPDYDDELTTLPDYAPLKDLLGTLRFFRH
jgi:hypothetical protein